MVLPLLLFAYAQRLARDFAGQVWKRLWSQTSPNCSQSKLRNLLSFLFVFVIRLVSTEACQFCGLQKSCLALSGSCECLAMSNLVESCQAVLWAWKSTAWSLVVHQPPCFVGWALSFVLAWWSAHGTSYIVVTARSESTSMYQRSLLRTAATRN